MAKTFKNIIIVGAGGNLGPHIFSALDSNPSFTVSVLSRAESKSTFPSHTKVHTVADLYPSDALVAAFKGQDAVIDLAPLQDIEQRKRSIDAAVIAGVKRYIPGGFGSNTEEPRIAAAVPIFNGKTTIRDYLKSKESTGLTWTGVINGPFYDWGLLVGFLGFDLKAKKALIYDDGNHYNDMTLISTVGKAVAGILLRPEETANCYVYVNSFRVTQNQTLAALEKATGGAKWDVEKTSSEEEGKRGRELLAKGDFSGAVPAICGVEYSGADYLNFERFGLWNGKLGLPKTNESFEEVVKTIVEKGLVE